MASFRRRSWASARPWSNSSLAAIRIESALFLLDGVFEVFPVSLATRALIVSSRTRERRSQTSRNPSSDPDRVQVSRVGRRIPTISEQIGEL
jgi:hypothetical protein